MSINSFMFKRIMMWVITVFLVLCLVHNIFSVKPEINGNALTETYNVTEVSSEEEALNVIKESNITNVVFDSGTYILKTDKDTYYQLPATNSVIKGLELKGATNPEGSESSESFLRFLYFAIIFIGVTAIVNVILRMRQERKMIETAERLAFSDIMVGDGFTNFSQDQRGSMHTKKEDTSADKIKKVTFDDVQGIDELKPDLYRLVDCLKNPKKYQDLGARMPKGMILYGPPGTGKTLIAKALAGEAGVPFHSACGSDFVEKYVGVGAQRVRELYKQARKSAPSIVFIDEIDAVGGGRGDSNNSEKDQTINALLAELDGFKGSDNVLTICATNRLDILDPALMRAGRFDLKLAVGLPDKEGREAILKLHSKNKKLAKGVNIPHIAKQTVGFSGAELEALLNESALIAAANDKKSIDTEDIENAFFKIIMQGNKKKNKEDDKQLELIAWHESGHTLITKLLTKTGVPTVTIIGSTSGAGGVTFMSPEEEKLSSKKDLRNEIKISYGGRAAEELLLGNSEDITTGASADIRQATSVIKSYISNYGMGDKGLLDVKQLTSQYDVLDEATKLSNELYKETIDFLRENLDKLKALATALLEKETLYEDEIDVLLGLKSEEEVNLNKKNMFEVEETEENEADFSELEEDVKEDIEELIKNNPIENDDVIIDIPDFLKGKRRK